MRTSSNTASACGARDQSGFSIEEIFTVYVTNINETPTEVALSAATVAENLPAATAVGQFSSTDPDLGDTFTYTLIGGDGAADNDSFTIANDQLRTTAAFNYEDKSTYNVHIRATDRGGLTFEKAFTVYVTNVNEQPTDVALSTAVGRRDFSCGHRCR